VGATEVDFLRETARGLPEPGAGRVPSLSQRSGVYPEAVIPEAPFLFSIAAISASLAALAGLVAGLRRGEGLRPLDLYRLREIVEFAFFNVLLALAIIPVATMVGLDGAIRVAGAVTFGYLIGSGLFLDRRRRKTRIAAYRSWAILVLSVVIPALGFAAIAAATGAVWALEIMLLLLLARPMAAFLLVLSTFGTPPQD
jgi:hypothetical protein